MLERMLVEDGILLRTYWFPVSDAEQTDRFRSRLEDPVRRWELAHLLSTVDYERREAPLLELPERPPGTGYVRPPRDEQNHVPDHAATLPR